MIMYLLMGTNMYAAERNLKEMKELQIGTTYDEIVAKFGKPDMVREDGNFLSIQYCVDQNIFYKLEFSLSAKLNTFSIVNNGVEIILFCDLRIN